MDIFAEFHESICFHCSLSATFIPLNPKMEGATHLRDFWLISLEGSMFNFKLITMTLARRLQGVLVNLIS